MSCAAPLQVKMRELGVLGNANYKLVCMLDHKAMLTVQTEKYGVFDCKPLQFIWTKVRHCCLSQHNTAAASPGGRVIDSSASCLGSSGSHLVSYAVFTCSGLPFQTLAIASTCTAGFVWGHRVLLDFGLAASCCRAELYCAAVIAALVPAVP